MTGERVADPTCQACDHPRSKHVPADRPHLCLLCPCYGYTAPSAQAVPDHIGGPVVQSKDRGLAALFLLAVILAIATFIMLRS